MASYLFYPRLPDGTALTFEVRECADDTMAGAMARAVLSDHGSAVEVAIWRGEWLVDCIRAEAATMSRCEIASGSRSGAAAE